MKASKLTTAVVTGLALLATGCGNGGNGGDATVGPDSSADETAVGADFGGVTELNIYTQWNAGTPFGTLQAEVIEQYEQETGITVNVADAVGDSALDAYEAQVAAGNEADLVIINAVPQTRTWIEKGAAVDVQPYLEDWGISEKLTEGATDGWADPEGRLLALPYVGYVWPVYWNTALLEQVGVEGVPQTKDEFLDAAAKLNAEGITPFVVGGGDWTGNALLLQLMNSYTPRETMEKVWAEGGYCETPEVKKSIDYFVELRDADVFVEDAEGYMMDQQNQTFFTGGAAAMSGGSWWFMDVPDDMVDDVVLGGVPVPSDGEYDKPMAVQGSTSGGFFVSENGAEKEEAVRAFVEMFYTQEIASKVVTDTGALPVVQMDPAPEADNPLVTQAVSTLPDEVAFIPSSDDIWPTRISEMASIASMAYSKERTAEQICADIDALYN